MSEELERTEREDLFSKAVKAGKRTYFFDVKSTRGNDYYLTITESKKRFGTDGKFTYEKHKIFLYKEDFEKFNDSLKEVMDFIIKERGLTPLRSFNEQSESITDKSNTDSSNVTTQRERSVNTSHRNSSTKEFTDLRFEDLGEGLK